MYRKLSALTLLTMLSTGTQALSFTYDGKFVASEYDRIFSIDYEYDGKTILGGTLALATDGNKQYMYISHPLGFKDFSYGNESDQIYRVGWDGQDDGNITLDKAVKSEFFEFSLTSDSTSYPIKFDLKEPIDKSKINGTEVDAGQAINIASGINIGFISTLDYNANLISGSFDGSLDVFAAHSPETLTPDEISGCADEASSDPLCYQLRNTAENMIGGSLLDWQFEFGLEIELARVDDALFFGDLLGLDLLTFGYQSGSAIISLDELHVSDPKTISSFKHDPLDCLSGGTSPNHEPCSATVTVSNVPEPPTFALIGLGLLGIWYRRKTAEKNV